MTETADTTKHDGQSPRGGPRLRPWIRVSMFLILLGIVMRAALPSLVGFALERALSNPRNRLEVGNVDLELLAGRAVARDASYHAVETGARLAELARLVIEVDWATLATGRWRIERARVEEPQLLLAYDADGALNWASVSAGFDDDDQAEDEVQEPPGPFAFGIGELHIVSGSILLIDERREALADLRVSIGDVTFTGFGIERPERGAPLGWGLDDIEAREWKIGFVDEPEKNEDLTLEFKAGPMHAEGRLPVRLSIRHVDGAQVDIDARVDPSPFEVGGRVQWTNLDSRAVLSLTALEGVRIEKGRSSGDVTLTFSLAPGPKRGLEARGWATHDGLQLSMDRPLQLRAQLPHLRVELEELLVPIPESHEMSARPVTIHASSIELVEPDIHARLPTQAREREKLDEAALRAKQGEVGKPSIPAQLRVDAFVLERGSLAWVDPALGNEDEQHIVEIEVTAEAIRWPEPDASSVVGGGKISGSASWRDVQSPGVHSFIELFGMRIESGRSQGSMGFDVSFEKGPARGVHVRGKGRHDALALVLERDSAVRIQVPSLKFDFEDIYAPFPIPGSQPAPASTRLHLASCVVDAPTIEQTLGKGAKEPAPQTGVAPEEAASQSESPKGAFVLQIDDFRLDDGEYVRHDLARGPDHTRRVSGIDVTASRLMLPGLAFDRAKIEVGSLGREPLRIEGMLSPKSGELTFAGRRIDLAEWNPVIEANSPYSIARGTLSFDGRFDLRDERYDAPTTIRVHQIQAINKDDEFERTFGVSLTRAVTLLSDSNDMILLRLPIHGEINGGMSFDLVSVIRSALREAIGNSLGSVVASSVDLAGSALRRVGELAFLGIGEAAFWPGDDRMRGEAGVVLRTAGELVRETGGARLQIVPRVVTSDLVTLGIKDQDRPGLFDSIKRGAQTLIGGASDLDPKNRDEVMALVTARFEAVEQQLQSDAGLAPDRIVRKPWDGKIAEGQAAMMLRLLVK